MNPSIKRLRQQRIRSLAESAMVALVIGGKQSANHNWTAANAYDLAEAMQNEDEKRFGPLTEADL